MRQRTSVFRFPRNLGDVLYTFRYRRPLPNAILETAPTGQEDDLRCRTVRVHVSTRHRQPQSSQSRPDDDKDPGCHSGDRLRPRDVFEVALEDDQLKVVQEKHYRLVPASEVTQADLLRYRDSA